MALVYSDRVWMTTATTGTGTITLGSAVSGYLTFAQASIADGSTVHYVIVDGTNFERGVGTYTAGGTLLSRTTVLSSLSGGVAGTSAITLSGSATVFLSAFASDIAFLNLQNAFTLPQNISITTAVTNAVSSNGLVAAYSSSGTTAAGFGGRALNVQLQNASGTLKDTAGLFDVTWKNATAGSEASAISIGTYNAGIAAYRLNIAQGIYTNAVSDMGVDSFNTLHMCRNGYEVTASEISLTSTYTLTSQTAAQKLFNATTNGAYSASANTTYEFECFFTLSSMSSTSGSFGFALGGTAVITSQVWDAEANKVATLATAAASQNSINTAANTALATANTNTAGWARIKGRFRVTTAGTIIPQVSLGVAAAAIVGVNSYFRVWPLDTNTVTTIGTWT